MTYLSLFYIAVAFAQETTTQVNDETTTVEPKNNNNSMWALISIVPGIVIVMVCAVKQGAFKRGKNGKKCGKSNNTGIENENVDNNTEERTEI